MFAYGGMKMSKSQMKIGKCELCGIIKGEDNLVQGIYYGDNIE